MQKWFEIASLKHDYKFISLIVVYLDMCICFLTHNFSFAELPFAHLSWYNELWIVIPQPPFLPLYYLALRMGMTDHSTSSSDNRDWSNGWECVQKEAKKFSIGMPCLNSHFFPPLCCLSWCFQRLCSSRCSPFGTSNTWNTITQRRREKQMREAKGEQERPVSRDAMVSVTGAFSDVALPSLVRARQHLLWSCKLIHFLFPGSFKLDVLLLAT